MLICACLVLPSSKRHTFGYLIEISAAPLNTTLIVIVTIFYRKLNQNALEFFITCGLLIVRICLIFILKKKKKKKMKMFLYLI